LIEQWVQIIVKDLGPTGLLVLGLYFSFGRYLKSACDSLKVINGELGEIRDLLKLCIEVEKMRPRKG